MSWINQVVNMDCLEGLNQLPDHCIDLVLTDPPYNIDLAYHEYKDTMSEEDFWKFIENVYRQLYRVLKTDCHLTFTCSQKQIWIYKPMLEEIGFTFRHVGVWHNPKRKAGSYPGQWPYAWEPIMDFTKGDKFRKLFNGNSVGGTDVWVEEDPKGIVHPAARPVNCWKDLVGLLSQKGELVLDPFMGSGTTAFVCKELGRKYVGFEIDIAYCKMIEIRLQNIFEVVEEEKVQVEQIGLEF